MGNKKSKLARSDKYGSSATEQRPVTLKPCRETEAVIMNVDDLKDSDVSRTCSSSPESVISSDSKSLNLKKRISSNERLEVTTLSVSESSDSNLNRSSHDKDFDPMLLDSYLNLAVQNGNLDEIKRRIRCDVNVNARNECGESMIIVACNSIEDNSYIVEFLIDVGADINLQDNNGRAALHFASIFRLQKSIKCLIQAEVNVNLKDKDGNTALHYATSGGYVNCMKLLLEGGADINLKNKYGCRPLLCIYLSEGLSKECAIKALMETCPADTEEIRTEYHFLTAAKDNDIDTLKRMLAANVNINIGDLVGWTALHYAANRSNIDVINVLIKIPNIDINAKNFYGDTPAHRATFHNNVHILRKLVQHNALLDVKNKNGDVPLHDACQNGSTEAIAFLLSTGNIDPNKKNYLNQSPIDLIKPDDKNRFEILKLFLPFQQCCENYPIDSYTKVFFCGNTRAGKSSLAAVLIQRAKKDCDHRFSLLDCVTNVVPLTAGIATHTLQSHEIGNVVLYDLAGHREYYSSHTAVLEHLMLQSPAVFCVLSKITNNDLDIASDFYYWFNFIENINVRVSQPSQVIVVASHVDLKDSNSQFKVTLDDVVRETIHRNKFSGFVAVDCHRPAGKGVEEFVSLLAKSCKEVVDKSDSISIYSHVLYAFLLTLNMVAISLRQLQALLKEKNDSSLPSNETVLIELLTILSDKGLILFLRRKESESWIIIKKEALLEEVNGVLFAPSAIKRVYRQIASNTGLVPVYALKSLFHDRYDTGMLVSFLIILEFCHVLDADTLEKIPTNLSPLFPTESEQLLYIPALVSAERPPDICLTEGVGWCLWCNNPHQFFSTRFLFLLLLRLAFKYCLRKCGVGEVKGGSELARCCTLWKDGIYWTSNNGVKVIVQMSENNRCVTVLTSNSRALMACQLQSKIISDIFSLQKDTCPSYDITECLISSADVGRSLTDRIRDIPVFVIGNVTQAMLTNAIYVTDGNGKKTVEVSSLFNRSEPFSKLCPVFIKEIFLASKTSELPSCYLHYLQICCSDIMKLYMEEEYTFLSIRDHLCSYSMFAGRNPLDVAFPQLTDKEIKYTSKDFIKLIKGAAVTVLSLPGTLDINAILDEKPQKLHLQKLLSSIKYQWRIIGETLQVRHEDIMSLEYNSTYDNTIRLSQVLQFWMDQMKTPVSWCTIIKAIEEPPINNATLAQEIRLFLSQPDTQSEYKH